jgi:bifunctional enzyme CysN/CysC
MGDAPLLPGRSYLLRIGHAWSPVVVSRISHKLDIDHLQPLAAQTLTQNEIGQCVLTTSGSVAFDVYRDNRETGSFILVDRYNDQTLAAGMISSALHRAIELPDGQQAIDKSARSRIKAQAPCIVWFTGLSASGKTTIARHVEARLHAAGYHTYTLDGDKVRHGLNADLGFSDADRVENIRRAGEMAKIFVDAGLIVLCAFISPFAAERRIVRDLVEADEFIEVFVDTPLEECIRRDPKGLYAKARAGGLRSFTGFNSAYEPPAAPDLVLRTTEEAAEQLAQKVIE